MPCLVQAMFENLTVQPQFAHFFLAFMNGRYNFTGLINDLTTLDADLYKNLMWLKAYEVNWLVIEPLNNGSNNRLHSTGRYQRSISYVFCY